MTLPPGAAAECRALSRYLAGIEPTAVIEAAYVRAHARMPASRSGAGDALDTLLLRAALLHPFLTRLADGYARYARPTGLLRQKLVLVCAILESSPPAHHWFDTARTGPVALAAARVMLAGMASVLALAAGALLFAGPHLILAAVGRTRPAAAA